MHHDMEGVRKPFSWNICWVIVVGVWTAGAEKPDKSWLNVQYEVANSTKLENTTYVINSTTKFEQLRNGENRSMDGLMGTKNPSILPNNLPTAITPFVQDTRFKGPTGPRITTPKPSAVVSDEDKKVRKDWGGNCTVYHWEICSNQTVFGKDVIDPETQTRLASQLSCEDPDLFPPVCLFNGWTVTRCHLLCMSKECNKELKTHYEKYVSKDGFC